MVDLNVVVTVFEIRPSGKVTVVVPLVTVCSPVISTDCPDTGTYNSTKRRNALQIGELTLVSMTNWVV